MPNRIIRDGILTSERVNALSDRAELFYRRLMSVVDDFGRFTANPMLLRAACYPLQLDRVKDSTITACLDETVNASLVVVYVVDGKSFLEIQDFKQRTRASASKWPSPDGHVTVTRPSCAHGDGDGDGDGEKPSRSTDVEPDAFDSKFWPAYPRKVAKASAAKAFAKIKPDDALLSRMLVALERQRGSEQWQRDDGRFIPHAATWLNQRRWEDEVQPVNGFDPASFADGAVL